MRQSARVFLTPMRPHGRVVVGVGTKAILGVVITVVVALALLPIITDFINDPKSSG